MKKTINLTCIECPRGCEMSVTVEEGKVTDVQNNFCIKGKRYAENECVCPRRTLTTTVRLSSGEMLPVKTDREVRKDKILGLMPIVREVRANKPVTIGQTVFSDIDGEGTNLIACKTIV